MAQRWEKERGAWVLSRAGRRSGARRRGEELSIRGRRDEANRAGVADSGSTEVATRGWIYRNIMREEGLENTLGWLIFTVLVLGFVGILVGPGLLLGAAMYGLWWLAVPSVEKHYRQNKHREFAGYLRPWPYLAIFLVAVLGGGIWINANASGFWTTVLMVWVVFQLSVAPLRAAWKVWANGWSAVAKKAKTSTSKSQTFVVKMAPRDEQPEKIAKTSTEPVDEEDTYSEVLLPRERNENV